MSEAADGKAGFKYPDFDKYPPEIRALAEVLVKHEEDLSDGFHFYLGWEWDAGPLIPILYELRAAACATP